MLKKDEMLVKRRNSISPDYIVVTILELDSMKIYLKIKFPNEEKWMSEEEFYNEFEIINKGEK